MTTVYQKVLFPCVSSRWESLPGFVARVANDNLHGSTGPIMQAAGYSFGCARVEVADLQNLTALAQVLQVNDTLIGSMAHPTIDDPAAKDPTINFFGAHIPRSDLEYQYRRVCPSSLTPSVFHHAIWSHRLIPYCPISGAMIIDKCPNPACERHLRWAKTAGIDHCENCLFDLKTATADYVDPAIRALVDPVIALINPDPAYHGPAVANLAEPLRGLNRGQVFELGWRLAVLCCPSDDNIDSRMRNGLTVQQKLERLALAGRALHNWPHGIRSEIKKLIDSIGVDRVGARFKWFRSKSSSGGTTPSLDPFVRAQLPELFDIEHTFTAALTFSPNLIGAIESSRLMRINPRDVAKLHRAGLLSPAFSKGGEKRILAGYDRSAIKAMAAKFDDRMEAASFGYRNGLPMSAVEQLICVGYLTEVDEPAVRAIFPVLHVQASSAKQLLATISGMAQRLEGPSISLSQALATIGGREKPVGPIIKAMVEGKLPFAVEPDGRKLLSRISVRACDIETIQSFAFDAAAYPTFSFAPTVSRADAELILNTNAKAMVEILRGPLADILVAGSHLDRDKVIGLAKKRIAVAEIAHRWLNGSHVLPRPLRDDPDLKMVDAFGRDRCKVEQFFLNR